MLNDIFKILAIWAVGQIAYRTLYPPVTPTTMPTTGEQAAASEMQTATTEVQAAPARERTASTASQDTCSVDHNEPDSGYVSDELQGLYSSYSKTTQRCLNNCLDDVPSKHKEIADGIVIRHEHLLYTIIAVLAVFIIDKRLLAFPIAALLSVAAITLIFAPCSLVERVLNLRIAHMVEVQYKEVIKHVEKSLHDESGRMEAVASKKIAVGVHEVELIEPTSKVASFGILEPTKPCEQEMGIIFVDVPVEKIVEVEKTVEVEKIVEKIVYLEKIVEIEKLVEVAPKSTPVHAEVQTETHVYTDSTTSTESPVNAIAQVQTPSKSTERFQPSKSYLNFTYPNKISVTSVIAENTSSPTASDLPHRHGVHSSEHIVKENTEDDVVELGRPEDHPFPSVPSLQETHWKNRIMNIVQVYDYQHKALSILPYTCPGSPATSQGFDPMKYTKTSEWNKFMWVETGTRRVYVSTNPNPKYAGCWLILGVIPETYNPVSGYYESGALMFRWMHDRQLWWCFDHGVGFYEHVKDVLDEDLPDYKAQKLAYEEARLASGLSDYEWVYGDYYSLDPSIKGPDRATTNDKTAAAGPYWYNCASEWWFRDLPIFLKMLERIRKFIPEVLLDEDEEMARRVQSQQIPQIPHMPQQGSPRRAQPQAGHYVAQEPSRRKPELQQEGRQSRFFGGQNQTRTHTPPQPQQGFSVPKSDFTFTKSAQSASPDLPHFVAEATPTPHYEASSSAQTPQEVTQEESTADTRISEKVPRENPPSLSSYSQDSEESDTSSSSFRESQNHGGTAVGAWENIDHDMEQQLLPNTFYHVRNRVWNVGTRDTHTQQPYDAHVPEQAEPQEKQYPNQELLRRDPRLRKKGFRAIFSGHQKQTQTPSEPQQGFNAPKSEFTFSASPRFTSSHLPGQGAKLAPEQESIDEVQVPPEVAQEDSADETEMPQEAAQEQAASSVQSPEEVTYAAQEEHNVESTPSTTEVEQGLSKSQRRNRKRKAKVREQAAAKAKQKADESHHRQG